MNQTVSPTPARHAALARMQQLMSASPVPSISTELLAMADGEFTVLRKPCPPAELLAALQAAVARARQAALTPAIHKT